MNKGFEGVGRREERARALVTRGPKGNDDDVVNA